MTAARTPLPASRTGLKRKPRSMHRANCLLPSPAVRGLHGAQADMEEGWHGTERRLPLHWLPRRATRSPTQEEGFRPQGPAQLATGDGAPKPKWEFPRLCRGGSKSLTYPGVEAPRSIAATRRAAKHTKGIASMDGLKADALNRRAVMRALLPSKEVRRIVSTHDVEAFLCGGGQPS